MCFASSSGTDDCQTVASSQHERIFLNPSAINQTDINPSVRIHKNTHTSCVYSALARPTVIHSITVVVLVGRALSVMTSFIPSDNAKSLIMVVNVLDVEWLYLVEIGNHPAQPSPHPNF